MGRLQVVSDGVEEKRTRYEADGSTRFAVLKKTQISTFFFG